MRPNPIPSMGSAWLRRRLISAGSIVFLTLSACAQAVPPTQHHTPRFLIVRAACTSVTRERGLSGDPPPPLGTAQLFVFDRQARHGVTMRGMKYDLDIAWLGDDGKVLRVDQGVSHATLLGVSQVRIADSRYVLELAAGDAAREGLRPGTHVRALTSSCTTKNGAFHAVSVE